MTHSTSLPLSLACLLAAASLACTDDGNADADASTTTTTETGDGDGDPTTGDGDGDGDPTTGDGDGDGEPAECGNGQVEPGEDCDDANDVDTDFCTSACTAPCALEWEQPEPGIVEGNQIDFGDMKIDGAGNIVVATQRDDMQGDRQAWVAKFDATGGTMMWETTLTGASGISSASSLALGADDDVYVTGTRIGADIEDIWYARLAAADGGEVWNLEHDGMLDGSEDRGIGVATGADGVVLVGTVRDVAMDDDIWISKVDFDGNELWTNTYSGPPAGNGFSLDNGGFVTVADDGTVYATGNIYIDFETLDLVILSYAADGTGPDWELMPESGGTGHRYYADGIAHDGAGSVYVAFYDASSPIGTFWVSKYDTATGEAAWTLSNAELAVAGDAESWGVSGLTATAGGGVALGGSWFNDEYDSGVGRREGYVAYFDGDGSPLCYGSHGLVDPPASPGSVYINAVAQTAGGQVVGHGGTFDGMSLGRWLGQFGAPQ